MSTFQQTAASNNELGISRDPEISIPSCTIEDVDRALFTLFNEDLDLFYKQEGTIVRVPIVFATGERFAILSRNKPLRDDSDALILPLISIARTGMAKELTRGMGTNQSSPITIKRRLSQSDPLYQRLVNREGLQYQDDRVSNSHKIVTGLTGSRGKGTKPGEIATRRPQAETESVYRQGHLLQSKVGNNIYEIYEIPNVRYYNASYEITFWTQYTQQMNDLLMTFMSSSHTNGRLTFRIETSKGYYFVAYLEGGFSPGNNFSDFTDEERLVRYSFSMTVPAYIVAPDYEGARNTIRRFVSAPEISFGITGVYAPIQQKQIVPVASADLNKYMLNDLEPHDAPLPGQSIVTPSTTKDGGYYDNSAVGGTTSGRHTVEVVRSYKDPVTDEVKQEVLPFKSRNQRKGETVYQAQLTDDLGTILVVSK